jgi:HTH-type transcriptional regulator / antitoxin HigA
VKESFNTADFVTPHVASDIGGNKYRPIAGDELHAEGVVHPPHHDAQGICERSVEDVSATLSVDPKKYARLANRIVVKAIETEEEYGHMVAAVERLMDKGEDRLSPEEAALLETMAILVQAYDDRHHPLPSVAPNEMLAYLMETSGRTARDLLPVLGTRGRVSEVLSGKRSISKEQAKRLAAVFKVAVDLFI